MQQYCLTTKKDPSTMNTLKVQEKSEGVLEGGKKQEDRRSPPGMGKAHQGR